MMSLIRVAPEGSSASKSRPTKWKCEDYKDEEMESLT